MERLMQEQDIMKGGLDHVNGKVDQILEVVTAMAREERAQQRVAVRNVVPTFPSVSQSSLINAPHEGSPRHHPQFAQRSMPIPQPRLRDPVHIQARPRVAQERKPVQFEPLPISYSELLSQLVQRSLVFPQKLKSVVYPYLPGYNPNTRCGFHEGSSGHTTEDCKTLKYKVKELIDNKVLMFKRSGSKVDILINRPDNAQGKGPMVPVEIPYPNLVLNNPMATMEPPNGGGNSEYGKRQSSAGYPHTRVPMPIEIPYQQGRLIIAQGYGKQKLRYPQRRLGRPHPVPIPIPIPCGQLLPYLVQNSLLMITKSLPPVPLPFPPGFDPDAQCEYHNGSMGHSIEDCHAFKAKVRSLIKCGQLVFEEDNPGIECRYHTGAMGHVVKECENFQNKLQRLISKEDSNVDGLVQRPGKEKTYEPLSPLRILYHKEMVQPVENETPFLSDKSVETIACDTIAYASEELVERSEKVVSCENVTKGDSKSGPTDPDEDINLWVGKRSIDTVTVEVNYGQDMPARPYGPSSSQRSSVSALYHPYGQPTMPKAPYQKPWVAPHANQRAHGRGYLNQHMPRNNLERSTAPLHPVPVPYSQLLQPLIRNSLVEPKSLKEVPKPYPPGYDPKARCGYHAGSMGHSTEDCKAFQAKIQQLIDNKYISFQEGNLVVHVSFSPE